MTARALAYSGRVLRRAAKHAAQRLRPAHPAPRALFVVGAQRSGTTMLLHALEHSPRTWVYQEYHRAAFRPDWHLRPEADLRGLIVRARCPWVVFKPLFDTQNVDHLLDAHPGAKALFVFRDWRAVARSSAAKWGDAMRNAVRRLATEEPCEHWMAERLPEARRRRLGELYHDALSLESASALRWWLRNEIFFDLSLAEQPERVRLVRYESLVADPIAGFAPLFAFLALDADARVAAEVGSPSVRPGSADVEPAIAALCDDTLARLEAAAREQAP